MDNVIWRELISLMSSINYFITKAALNGPKTRLWSWEYWGISAALCYQKVGTCSTAVCPFPSHLDHVKLLPGGKAITSAFLSRQVAWAVFWSIGYQKILSKHCSLIKLTVGLSFYHTKVIRFKGRWALQQAHDLWFYMLTQKNTRQFIVQLSVVIKSQKRF